MLELACMLSRVEGVSNKQYIFDSYIWYYIPTSKFHGSFIELLFLSFVLLFLSRTTGKRILSLIALSLDLDAEFFHKNGAFEPPSAFLRLLHYAGKFHLFFLALL